MRRLCWLVQFGWCEARRLLVALQPDTAESVVKESVVQASDVVDRRQAAPHTQRRLEPAVPTKRERSPEESGGGELMLGCAAGRG